MRKKSQFVEGTFPSKRSDLLRAAGDARFVPGEQRRVFLVTCADCVPERSWVTRGLLGDIVNWTEAVMRERPAKAETNENGALSAITAALQ